MISEPTVEVSCDTPNCGQVERFELTAIACNGYDSRHLKQEMENAGWETTEDGKHYCGDCVEIREETKQEDNE